MSSSSASLFEWSFCPSGEFADDFGSQLGSTSLHSHCNIEIALLPISHIILVLVCFSRLFRLRLASPSVVEQRCRNARLVHILRLSMAALLFLSPLVAVFISMPALQRATLLLQVLTWLLVFVIFAVEMRMSICSPPNEMFAAIFVCFVFYSVKFGYVLSAWSEHPRSSSEKLYFAAFAVNYASVAVLTISILPYIVLQYKRHIFPSTEPTKDLVDVELGQVISKASETSEIVKCPEELAGLYSRLFFTWMTPIMSLGSKQPIHQEDIWKLNHNDEAKALYEERFMHEWSVEMQKPPEERSLARALFRSYRLRFCAAALCKLISDLAQLSSPILLGLLISYMSTDPATVGTRDGVVYSILLFASGVVAVLAEGIHFQISMRIGMQARSIIVSAVFAKTLLLNNKAMSEIGSGKINNMVSSDAEAIQLLLNNIHSIWSAPARILLVIIILFTQLSWAGLIGSLLFIAVIPVQKTLMSKAGLYIKEALKSTDKRVKVIGGVFSSMNVIKCYAWEASFLKKVEEIRDTELVWVLKSAYLFAVNSTLVFIMPTMVAMFSFTAFVLLLDEPLTAEKAFTSLSLFAQLIFPLFQLPQLLIGIVGTRISSHRILGLLNAPESERSANLPPSDSLPAIQLSKSSFSWTESGGSGQAVEPSDSGEDKDKNTSTLKDVELSVGGGELVAVIGGTGQGKSSLVSALLGEINQVSGEPVLLRGRLAYVPQQSWIFNATVRDNIIFGNSFDERRFNRALEVASMAHDIELLPDGVDTEIGEKGVNLSGGQKQRVSIARAVYADADIYIFDDPLSALDAHVGKDVFEGCICDELKSKARVLVTNQVQFVSNADKIVFIDKGRIIGSGSYADLMANCEPFQRLVKQQVDQERNDRDNETDLKESDVDVVAAAQPIQEQQEERSVDLKDVVDAASDGKEKEIAKLIQAEERVLGRVNIDVLRYYYHAFGGAIPCLSLLVVFALAEALRVASSIWLQIWTSAERDQSENYFYLGIYVVWSMSNGLFTLVYRLISAHFGTTAAKFLHSEMFSHILKAPMLFFEQTPHGRLINRFSKDTSDVDKQLVAWVIFFIATVFSMISVVCVLAATLVVMLAVLVPVIIAYVFCWMYFQRTSRELKRLDSISRSPVYAHFSQSLNGISSIRAYRAEEATKRTSHDKLDANIQVNLAMFSANRWLGVRLEMLGSLVVLVCALLLIFQRDSFSASLSGLVLSYALQVTGLFIRMVRSGSLAENGFNSVERMKYYADVQPEEPDDAPRESVPAEWPSEGKVEFREVCLKYRENLPLVLNRLSVEFPARNKIGIVGRTGAGKSSIFVALFRLRELDSGAIVIDGRDISRMSVNSLRSRLAIIPQDPVLFTGTVRFNLDPFAEYSDAEVWKTLERAFLKDAVEALDNGLSHEVSEGGSNFSVGQRQLLCLARALLRKSSILVLDEATAAVDVQTDAQIQAMIREQFNDCTMLIIAHRLHTIIDADRILVMGGGHVLEYDTPRVLASNESGALTSMLNDTGAASAEFLKRVARGEEKASMDRLVELEASSSAQPETR